MAHDVSITTGLVITFMALVTLFARWIGFFLMSYVRMGPRLEAGFAALPGAVVAATIAPLIIIDGVSALAAVLVAGAIARLGWNDFFAVIGGLLVAILLRSLTG